METAQSDLARNSREQALVDPVTSELDGGVKSSRKRRKEARPQELMEAALDLFVEKGFAATRLDDVAARAGVSKGTLYLYFDSKEALFEAVIREGILPVMMQGEALVEQHQGNTTDLLKALLQAWWDCIGGTRLAGVPKLMVSESGNFPDVAQYYAQNVIVRGRNLLQMVLVRGIRTGEFKALDVESAIDVIFAPLLMLAIWRFSLAPCCQDQKADPQRYLQTHFDLILNGLCSATGAELMGESSGAHSAGPENSI